MYGTARSYELVAAASLPLPLSSVRPVSVDHQRMVVLSLRPELPAVAATATGARLCPGVFIPLGRDTIASHDSTREERDRGATQVLPVVFSLGRASRRCCCG
jgi:hypothetical protein